MISTQDSEENSFLELPPPPQFEKVDDLVNMTSERLRKSPLVNLIGLVKDYQPPFQTKGQDAKCTFAVVDLSTQVENTNGGNGIKVTIFGSTNQMPHISGVRDVVLLRKFKVQMWDGYISLLFNWASAVQVFHAAQISPGLIPKPALSKSAAPSLAEAKYAAWLFLHVDQNMFPSATDFQEKSEGAMGVKEKFSLLKDAKADNFYDLIGEVIRVYERDGRVTLYLSDYTPHSLFYNNVWGGGNDETSTRDGDEYGYTKSRKKDENDWPGPFGKLTIQITVYDDHAAFIREQVKVSNWVILKNVHLKMGRQGGCLEGFLRGDRSGWGGTVGVRIIKKAEDAEKNDVRWKDGLRRKLQWWAKFRKQKQKYLDENQGSGDKRKAEAEISKPNSKIRRKEKRAAAEQRVVAVEQKVAEKLDLNSNVKCNYPNKAPTPLAAILHTAKFVGSASGLEYSLPFENLKYRSNVRVIDFWPNNLQDFTVGRRVSEYEVLSDYSGGESTDNEGDMLLFKEGKGYGGEKAWEWRFALHVQDADKKARHQDDTMWLIVDNQAGQMLLNMDAVNLRQEDEALTALREVLFNLWGDLEERKSAYLKGQNEKASKYSGDAQDSALSGAKQKAQQAKAVDDLPPDSEDESTPKARSPKNLSTIDADGNPLENDQPDVDPSVAILSLPISNKGFACCIQQYGIKVPEGSPSKADAGEGYRWKGVFGLFGTMIA